MINQQTVMVNSVIDIINARMLVREAARHIGMSLTDQFCISLATSSLAESIGLGMGQSSSEIVINYVPRSNSKREGIHVACIYHLDHDVDMANAKFAKIRNMVDEFTMHELADKRMEISMVKWHN